MSTMSSNGPHTTVLRPRRLCLATCGVAAAKASCQALPAAGLIAARGLLHAQLLAGMLLYLVYSVLVLIYIYISMVERTGLARVEKHHDALPLTSPLRTTLNRSCLFLGLI